MLGGNVLNGKPPSEVKKADPADGRKPWDWQSKYSDAISRIRKEAIILAAYLLSFGLLTVLCFASAGDLVYVTTSPVMMLSLRHRDVLVWLVGSVGGTVFAIKWLVHSVANGLWHEDRFLWRIFVPLTGGIYALVVLALLHSGLLGGEQSNTHAQNTEREVVIAFLAGYFADGVSGLLTNVANAIFGKVES